MNRRRNPHTILVVDDDAAVRRPLVRLLELDGYTVVEAQDGGAALSYLAGGGSASVILLDLRMPVMDGWTFRREQRGTAAIAHIPVIVLSGADAPRFIELDAAATFQKPVRMAELRTALENLCE